MQSILRQAKRWFVRLRRNADKPWYVALVALLAAVDLFIVVVPTDWLFLSCLMGKKGRIVSPVIWTSLGAAVGAVALAAVVQLELGITLDGLLASAGTAPSWLNVDEVVRNHGAWGLGLISLLPVPQTPTVIFGALAQVDLFTIFVAFAVGRLVKYAFLAWCFRFAPSLLRRFVRPETDVTTPA